MAGRLRARRIKDAKKALLVHPLPPQSTPKPEVGAKKHNQTSAEYPEWCTWCYMGPKEYEETKGEEQEGDVRGTLTALPTMVTTARTITVRENAKTGRRRSSWFERIKEKRKEMKA